MNELDVSNTLFKALQKFGAIKWHKNKNHSFYIKFKDTRLGSIRISNHRGRSKYSYTYEIFKSDENIDNKIQEIIQSIEVKAKSLEGFNPKKYVVFDYRSRKYKEVLNYNNYRNSILKKKILNDYDTFCNCCADCEKECSLDV